MPLPLEHPDLIDYERALTDAARSAIARIDELYPVGSVIEATMGNARIRLEITATKLGSWNPLYETTYIYGKNIKTGRQRKLSVTYEAHEIITLSKRKQRTENQEQ